LEIRLIDVTIGDNDTYAPPIYDRFIDATRELGKKWVFSFFVGWTPHGGITQRWYEAVLK
jgi:hypothetical protein